MLIEFIKLYLDQEKKFSRELYNILNLKLYIFYNCYQKVRLKPNQYYNAYFIILKGQASTFYYNYLAGKGYEFNRIIYKTRYHFKTEENKQQYILKQREIIFLKIIAINLDVS